MDDFQTPFFHSWCFFYTAIGAAVVWGKWGRETLKPYILSDLIGLLPLSERLRNALEFLLFILIGCLVSIGVVQPVNPTQAIAAGMGWTGIFTVRS